MPFGGPIFAIIWPPSLRVPAVEDWLKVFPSYSYQALYFYWSNSGRSKTSRLGQTKKFWRGSKRAPSDSWSKNRLGGMGLTEVEVQRPNFTAKNLPANLVELRKLSGSLVMTGFIQHKRVTGSTSPTSKRKICSRRRPSTRTFVWIFVNKGHFCT